MPRKPQAISITAIAAEAGVSVATISRVMNRRTGASEETRKRIDAILLKHNFKPNYPAARDARIAVLLPTGIFSRYIARVLNGVYEYANNNGLCPCVIVKDMMAAEPLLAKIRDFQCSGVIVVMPDLFQAEHLELAQSELPVIFVDTKVDIEGVGYIDHDAYSGATEAAKHLLGLGHRKIGFLQYLAPTFNQEMRFKGFSDALKAAGAAMKPEWVSSLKFGDGNAALLQLLSRAPELTAVMAVDDSYALGALHCAHKLGKRIPHDISIVGFDNDSDSAVYNPSLTTVNHPVEKAAMMAIESIHRYLMAPNDWTPLRETLPTSLIPRESTGQSKYKDGHV